MLTGFFQVRYSVVNPGPNTFVPEDVPHVILMWSYHGAGYVGIDGYIGTYGTIG